MLCPSCYGKTRVIDCRGGELSGVLSKVRKRVCLSCGKVFYTREEMCFTEWGEKTLHYFASPQHREYLSRLRREKILINIRKDDEE